MAIRVRPYVPYQLIVHLGLPSANATNVSVRFPDYVKNVASSEIYPTWEPAAIQANILAIISYALNRVYTEFYPSQGYNFNITSTTAFDQKYTPGGVVFDNISTMVDEIFTNYIRRIGSVEPLAAKFCNGTTSICSGMSQWGSQNSALKGKNYIEILREFYGENIEIVTNAPMDDIIPSYDGTALRLGSLGQDVTVVQVSLNRISQNYPAIPKISPVNGVYNEQTQQSVKEFQRIFNLYPDGIVGKSTWYRLVYLYTGVNQLSELVSLGQNFYEVSFQYTGPLSLGDRGESVEILQYMLTMLAEFDRSLRVLQIDGVFGMETKIAVETFQFRENLASSGVVDYQTWDKLYKKFYLLENSLKNDGIRFPSSGNYQLTIPGQFGGTAYQFGNSDGG